MAKKQFSVGMLTLGLVFAFLLTGCLSMAGRPQNVEALTDLSSVPEVTAEATPVEGIWGISQKQGSVVTTTEYTFHGNRFTMEQTWDGNIAGQRGIISVADNTLVFYILEAWNPTDNKWDAYGFKRTNVWVVNGKTLTIDKVKYSKIGSPSPIVAAQSYGVTISENESLVILRRITGTGMSMRIGEPAEWQVFIDGELSTTVGKNKTIAFTLPNGPHTIYVHMGKGADKVAKSEEITINAQSNLVRLETEVIGGAANQQVILRRRLQSQD